MTTRRPTTGLVWLAVTALVSLAWTVNFLAPFIWPAYRPDPSITSLFTVVVGGVVAVQVERADRHRADAGPDHDTEGDPQ
ncbi:hypothetical protein [Kutzneria chonburiensis]|uniref:Uncharacterized protein n=1 Tax=Kutzneria chonburiensis TaxID=1483604 RepID=A0ABV6N2U4_9PSEU|nr:hypothetical protein [Kutzneria chonburiensis]